MPVPGPGPILLLTRPRAAAQRFAAQVGLQIETLIAPLLQIDLLDIAPQTDDLRGIILTSENGALAAGRIAGLPRPAWCVGARTAQAAKDQGFAPLSADGNADDLIALILLRHESGPLLHLHGEHVRGDIAQRLITAGVAARSIPAYSQTSRALAPEAVAAFAGQRPIVLPLFSPRTVTILAEYGPFNAPLHIVPISAVVADVARMLHPASTVLSDAPDADAMVRAVRTSVLSVSSK